MNLENVEWTAIPNNSQHHLTQAVHHVVSDFIPQVFIGHAEAVSRVLLTPDSLSLISVGEAVFIWDFMAHAREQPVME